VDIVLNHMSGSFSCCVGTGGSHFDAATKDYPSVPYTAEHFHSQGNECTSESGQLEDYQDINQVFILLSSII